MTQYIPSAGVFLVHLDPKKGREPVVGFSVSDGGQVAFPVFLTAFDGFRSGMAYSLYDGCIFDPVWRRTFDSVEGWRKAVEADQPYIPGKVPGVSGNDGKTPTSMKKPAETAAAAANKTVAPKTEPKPTGRPPKELDVAPAGLVVMGTKTFKGKSFWRYTDENHDFVLTVEGGDPLPNDSCAVKITRDDYFAARKTLPEMALPAPGAANPDEPELPLESDEDDGTDMV